MSATPSRSLRRAAAVDPSLHAGRSKRETSGDGGASGASPQTRNGSPAADGNDWFLAEAVPDQVWTAHPDGSLDYVNQRVVEYFDRSFEEIVESGWRDVVHPGDLDRCLEVWTSSLSTGEPYEIEFRLRRRDGEYRWHLGRARAVRDANGRIVKWFGTTMDIHDQRRAEKEIRLIIETAAEGICTFDAEHRARFANRAIADLLGYSVEEMRGRSLFSFLPSRVHELAESYLAGQGVPEPLEVKLVRADGSRVWTSMSLTRLPDESGRYSGLLVMVTDIDERKRVEQREAVQHGVTTIVADAAGLADAAPRILDALCPRLGWDVGSVWEVDREADVLRPLAFWKGDAVDVAAFEAATRKRALARGVDLPGRVWESGAPAWTSRFTDETVASRRTAARREGLRSAFAFPVALADEVHAVVELASMHPLEPDPDLATILATIGNQIGQLVDREQVAAAVRESETLTRTVLDAAGVGIAMVDVEGYALLENAPMTRFGEMIPGGFPPSRTVYDELLAIAQHTTDPIGFRRAVEEIRDDHERESLDEFELRDSGRTFQRYSAPVRNSTGGILGRIFVLREVTAERAAERLKSELVATVSHELRTPLAGILGFAELLLDREVGPATRKRYVEMTYKEARRLSALLDDFLDLQRIEQRGMKVARRRFNLRALLAHEVELFSQQSDVHVLSLTAPRSLPVNGDRDRIAQVVGNLLSNAIKYSPGGGPVEVVAEMRDDRVRVSVADKGVGIPSEQQQFIFSRFFRVDSTDTRAIGGTGLGLSLSREIVNAHAGEMGFESASGEGSTFWFELRVSHTRAAKRSGARMVQA